MMELSGGKDFMTDSYSLPPSRKKILEANLVFLTPDPKGRAAGRDAESPGSALPLESPCHVTWKRGCRKNTESETQVSKYTSRTFWDIIKRFVYQTFKFTGHPVCL